MFDQTAQQDQDWSKLNETDQYDQEHGYAAAAGNLSDIRYTIPTIFHLKILKAIYKWISHRRCNLDQQFNI